MDWLQSVGSRMRRAAAIIAFGCASALMPTASPAGAASIFEDVPAFTPFDIDPSTRSRAMGGASGAVFWGTGPNDWANPALLGLAEGVAYEDATMQFPGFPFNAHRWTLGYGGIGLVTAERALSLGLTIDPLGSLSSSDKIHPWGIGASVSGIAATVAGLRHDDPPRFTRYADLAFGYNRKSWKSGLSAFGEPSFETDALGVDWGLLARGTVPFRLGPGDIPARAEAAYAYSVQNANDVSTTGALGPADRNRRHGVAVRFALDLPASWRDRLPSLLAPGFEPLVSLGGAWDRTFISVGSSPARWDESHLGGELGLGNVAFVRVGRWDDRHAWGYGLALPIGRLGGYRYDETRQGESEGLPGTTSHAWSVWANPVEIARTLR